MFPRGSLKIGKLSFRNYYTAWISILVRKALPTSRLTSINGKKGESGMSQFGRFGGNRLLRESFQQIPENEENPGGNGRSAGGTQWRTVLEEMSEEDSEDEKPDSNHSIPVTRHQFKSSDSDGLKFHKGTGRSDETLRRPWEIGIEAKTLMQYPSFEAGGQDYVTILESESITDWTDVIMVRFILHQPSTVWKKFAIQEVSVFGRQSKQGVFPTDLREDHLFRILKENTKAVLSGQIVEAERSFSDEELTSYS